MTILPDRRAQGLPEPLPLQILDAKPDCENHPGPAGHIVAVHHVDCCTLPDLTPDGASPTTSHAASNETGRASNA